MVEFATLGAALLAALTLLFLQRCVKEMTVSNRPYPVGWLLSSVVACILSAAALWVLGWAFKPAGSSMTGWWLFSAGWTVAGLMYLFVSLRRARPSREACSEISEGI